MTVYVRAELIADGVALIRFVTIRAVERCRVHAMPLTGILHACEDLARTECRAIGVRRARNRADAETCPRIFTAAEYAMIPIATLAGQARNAQVG
jgi:hypothetical protein